MAIAASNAAGITAMATAPHSTRAARASARRGSGGDGRSATHALDLALAPRLPGHGSAGHRREAQTTHDSAPSIHGDRGQAALAERGHGPEPGDGAGAPVALFRHGRAYR